MMEKNDISKEHLIERSGSPDIFDDEETVNDSVIPTDKILERTQSTITYNNTQAMDLTACISSAKSQLNNLTVVNKTFLSQDITKRKSNDFMEITNCIASSSQPIMISKSNDIKGGTKEIDCINLCQNSAVDFKNVKLDNLETMDLTQSSDSCELPEINLSNSTDTHQQTILLDGRDTINADLSKNSDSNNEDTSKSLGPRDITIIYSNNDEIMDLTLEIIKVPDIETNNTNYIEKELTEAKEISIFDASTNKDATNIDLTQSSDEGLQIQQSICISKSPKLSYGSLGKCDNISVDYDEIIDNDYEKRCSIGNEEIFFDPVNSTENKEIALSEQSSKTSDTKLSQDDEVFVISDNELDYSIQQSKQYDSPNNFELGGLSISNGYSKHETLQFKDESIKSSYVKKSLSESCVKLDATTKDNKSQTVTPSKKSIVPSIETPKTEYIIKTDQVTPMLDYASMETPDRNKELEKYGLKPFKRKRAIQLLTHLYNQTHPLIEDISAEELPSPSKKLKIASSTNHQQTKSIISPRKPIQSPRKISDSLVPELQKVQKQIVAQNCETIYKVTKDVPDISDIACDPDEWVFQKREKAKVFSCKVPLHIAFHNYVSCRRELREAILRYEPINIDVIHKDLVGMGFKYDPKDLLRYLDKKCITVKTADNNSRNNKRC